MEAKQAEIVPSNGGQRIAGIDALASLASRANVSLGETAAASTAERERALIFVRALLAKQNPRSFDVVRQRILADCARPRFAEHAEFKRPVGNKYNQATRRWEESFIEDVNIRFMESALRAFGNVEVSSVIVFDDLRKRIRRIAVLDLETGQGYAVEVVIEKTMERKKLREGQQAIGTRTNSYGDTVYIVEADEMGLAAKDGAATSKMIRTYGKKLLPFDLIAEARDMIAATNRDATKANPDAQRNRVVDGMFRQGVDAVALEHYLGHPIAQCSAKEIDELRKVYAALEGGDATWAEFVEARANERETAANEKKREKAPDDPRPADAGPTGPAPTASAKAMAQEVGVTVEKADDPDTWSDKRVLVEIGKLVPMDQAADPLGIGGIVNNALADAKVKKPANLLRDARLKLYRTIVATLKAHNESPPSSADYSGEDPADAGQGGGA